jgi:hypothetical protein
MVSLVELSVSVRHIISARLERLCVVATAHVLSFFPLSLNITCTNWTLSSPHIDFVSAHGHSAISPSTTTDFMPNHALKVALLLLHLLFFFSNKDFTLEKENVYTNNDNQWKVKYAAERN